MATATKTLIPSSRQKSLPPLENGDHLDQKTFHTRYEAMPNVCAELIGGIVYMASPMRTPHGRHGSPLVRWLDEYEEATPGTEVLLGATSILGPSSEPEPDACMIIRPECGGQTWEDEDEWHLSFLVKSIIFLKGPASLDDFESGKVVGLLPPHGRSFEVHVSGADLYIMGIEAPGVLKREM